MAERKAKFKRGEIVVEHFKDPSTLDHGGPVRIGWVEETPDGFIYRKSRWASWSYEEKNLRKQTRRERGEQANAA